MLFDDLQVRNIIYQSDRSLVMRVFKEKESFEGVLKVLNLPYPSQEQVQQFINECELQKSFSPRYVPRGSTYLNKGSQHGLLMEWENLEPLSKVMQSKNLTFKEKLWIAIGVLQTVSHMHELKIVHRNITPDDLLVDMSNYLVKIVGFHFAMKLESSERLTKHSYVLDQVSVYSAPEQTGRIKSHIGFYSDIYSIGSILFELFSEESLFSEEENIRFAHANLAKRPPLIDTIKSEVPNMVALIVNKMLMKNAGSRYQTVYGVLFDLKKCLSAYQEFHKVPRFILGLKDKAFQLNFPLRIIGRELELDKLISLYNYVRLERKSSTLFVVGETGIGKTTFVQEISQLSIGDSGLFVSGKFEQFQKDKPYSAILSVLNTCIDNILVMPDNELVGWRKHFGEVLGPFSHLLIELLPRLEQIVEKDGAVTQSIRTEYQTKTKHLLHLFLVALTRDKSSLTLFLDDFQWADSQSIEFIEFSADKHIDVPLMIICAYRDEFFYQKGSFLKFKEYCEKQTSSQFIHLSGLSVDSVCDLLQETLEHPSTELEEVAQVIHGKTLGNPYFIRQLLEECSHNNSIRFDNNIDEWKWNIEELRRHSVTDNLITLMVQNFDQLPNHTIEALGKAAILGISFDLDALYIVTGQVKKELIEVLWPAVVEGYITSVDNSYRDFMSLDRDKEMESIVNTEFSFVHESLREIARQKVIKSQQIYIHLKIGRSLLYDWNEEDNPEKIHQIIQHLNLAVEYIIDKKERKNLAVLNYKVSLKAQSIGSYKLATEYIDVAQSLLSSYDWEEDYDFCLNVLNAVVRLAVYSGDNVKMFDAVETIKSRVHHKIDLVDISEQLIMYYMSNQDSERALDVGLKILSELDLNFPSYPNKGYLWARSIIFETKYKNYNFKKLVTLPPVKDKQVIAYMRILSRLIIVSHFSRRFFLPLFVYKALQLSIKHGFHSCTLMAISNYAHLCIYRLDRIPQALSLANTSLSVIDRPEINDVQSNIRFFACILTKIFEKKEGNIDDQVMEIYNIAIKNGDLLIAALSLCFGLIHRLYMGERLSEVVNSAEILTNCISDIEHDMALSIVAPIHQMAVNLMGNQSHNAHQLLGPICDQQHHLKYSASKNNMIAIKIHGYVRIFLGFLLNQYQDVAGVPENDTTSTLPYGLIFEYSKRVMELDMVRGGARVYNLATRLKSNLTLLKYYARYNERLFKGFALGLEAEIAYYEGRIDVVVNKFHAAIKAAENSGIIYQQAILRERAGRFYMRCKNTEIAQMYLSSAYDLYKVWGAHAKAHQLEVEFDNKEVSFVSNVISNLYNINNTPHKTEQVKAKNSLEVLDYEYALGAFNAATHKTDTKDFLEVLMNTIYSISGAERGLLILKNDNGYWYINNYLEGEKVSIIEEGFPEDYVFSVSAVNYILRGGEGLIVDKAHSDQMFEHDEYVIENLINSLLCLPLYRSNELKGILYLENNLITGAFSGEKLKTLTLLSGQIMLAVENVQLYENSQRVNAELEQFNATLNQQVEKRTIELKNQSAVLSTTFANMDDGMLLIGPTGQIIRWNTKLNQMYSFSSNTIWKGIQYAEFWRQVIDTRLLDKKSEDVVQHSLIKLNIEEVEYTEWELLLSDRQYYKVRLRKMSNGLWVSLHQDITEERIRQKELQEAKEMAESVSVEKSQFLATMSHEIRTPMNGVLGMLEILERTSLDEKQNDIVSVMSKSARSLLHIIDNILDFSKIEAGKMEISNVTFSVTELLDDIIQFMYLSCADSQVVLQCCIYYGVPDILIGDRNRLQQILLNLISNALKFTNKGYVLVTVKLDEERSLQDQVYLIFQVEDTGIGIGEDQRHLLFQPFSHLSTSYSQHVSGTGLGLAICQKLTKLMGGHIGVDSGLGEGSKFWLSVPVFENIDTGYSAKDPVYGFCRVLLVGVDDKVRSLIEMSLFRAQVDITLSDSINSTWKLLDDSVKYHRKFDIIVIVNLFNTLDSDELFNKLAHNENMADISTILLYKNTLETKINIDKADIALQFPVQINHLHNALNVAHGIDVEGANEDDNHPLNTPVVYKSPSREFSDENGLVVLVVEDNETNQLVTKKQMACLGVHIDMAADGREALKLLEKKVYSMVLTDCRMPNMDGYELASAIRKKNIVNYLGLPIPIFALTANVMANESQICLEKGMNGYLSKPLSLDQLEEVLEEAVPSILKYRQKVIVDAFVEEEGISLIESASMISDVVKAPPNKKNESPLDLSFIEEVFGGFTAEAQEMMNFFIKSTSPIVHEMMTVEDHNYKEISFLCHKVAGAAHTAGAKKLAKALNKIELLIMQEQYSESLVIRETIPQLFQEVKNIIEKKL